jgi:hypothetical protein
MRERQDIEKEMFHAREDLEQNLGELKDTIREKVDVPNRVRHVVADGKQQARDLARRGVEGARQIAVRGKDGVVRVYGKSVDFTKKRPVLVSSIAAGVVVGVVGTILLFRWRARNRPWWEKAYASISP